MVEVFKTNVETEEAAQSILEHLYRLFEDFKINFDLEDCDCILRVESKTRSIDPLKIIKTLHDSGFQASVLLDKSVILEEENLPTSYFGECPNA